MLNEGFRPRSEEAHKTTFRFMKIALGKEYHNLIDYFDRGRVKRHKTIYQTIGYITETKVKQILKKAQQFISVLKELCGIR